MALNLYVARTQQHENGHNTWTRDKFLKIHTTCVSDARFGDDTAP